MCTGEKIGRLQGVEAMDTRLNDAGLLGNTNQAVTLRLNRRRFQLGIIKEMNGIF